MNELLDLVVVTPATLEPISVTEAKAHLRVTHTAEDALIAGYIAAARQEAERVTRRAILRQTLELRLNAWPQLYYLPRPPLVAITSVKYTNDLGVTQTLPVAAYTAYTGTEPGYIYFDTDQQPGDTLADTGAIVIKYTAGWATPSAVPPVIKAAMLLMVADLYTNRAPTGTQRTTAEQMLINNRVVWEWA